MASGFAALAVIGAAACGRTNPADLDFGGGDADLDATVDAPGADGADGAVDAPLPPPFDAGGDAADASDAPIDGPPPPPTACLVRFGDTGRQFANAVAIDGRGDILIAGTYDGTLDFGGGPLTGHLPNFPGGFVAMFDAACNPLWSKDFVEIGLGVAFEPDGSIWWLGSSPAHPHYVQLVHIDGSGQILDRKKFANNNGRPLSPTAEAQAMAIDAAGNIVLSGFFDGTISFGGDDLVGPDSAAGGVNLFVVKLDPLGGHVWSKQFGGGRPGHDTQAQSAAFAANGDVLVTGIYDGAMDFGGGALAAPTPPGYATFLARLGAANGAHVWSHGWSTLLPASPVALAAGGAIYFGGTVQATTDFGGGFGIGADAGPIGFFGGFLDDGSVTWLAQTGDGTPSTLAPPTGLGVTASGNLLGAGIGGGGAAAPFMTERTKLGTAVRSIAAAPNGWNVPAGGSLGQTVLTGALTGPFTYAGFSVTSAGQEDVYIQQIP